MPKACPHCHEEIGPQGCWPFDREDPYECWELKVASASPHVETEVWVLKGEEVSPKAEKVLETLRGIEDAA